MKYLFRLLLLLIPLAAVAQSSLPPCTPTGVKHMCFGKIEFKGGIDRTLEIYLDPWTYVGEFKDGKRNGLGTLTFTNSNSRYVGEWKDDQRHGQGTLTWQSTTMGEVPLVLLGLSEEAASTSIRGNTDVKYVGEWKNNQQNGRGTLTLTDGRKYVGNWVNAKRTFGTFIWPDGSKYVGEWKDDLRHGQGIQYLPNGSVRQSGNWRDGELVQSFAINTNRFSFNADSATPLIKPQSDPLKSERDRLAAEAESARKRQQELDQRLAHERAEKERLAAQVANQDSAPQRNSPLATGRNERRVALIVGNAKYAYNPLDNPVNDASDLDAALKSLGFKTALLRDATMAQVRNATRQFADDVATSDVALIFFAGHGIEARGRNYLIPVSADIKHEYELEDQAYDAGRWLDMLEDIKGTNKQRVNIVILDACRNNDLARGWRSSSRGLARMDAPTGTFIAFATAPGKVAMDGAKGQRNSPFTKNLLRAIQTPDVPIELMFKEVRRLVLEDTKNEQVPWDNSSLVGDFVFKKSR